MVLGGRLFLYFAPCIDQSPDDINVMLALVSGATWCLSALMSLEAARDGEFIYGWTIGSNVANFAAAAAAYLTGLMAIQGHYYFSSLCR